MDRKATWTSALLGKSGVKQLSMLLMLAAVICSSAAQAETPTSATVTDLHKFLEAKYAGPDLLAKLLQGPEWKIYNLGGEDANGRITKVFEFNAYNVGAVKGPRDALRAYCRNQGGDFQVALSVGRRSTLDERPTPVMARLRNEYTAVLWSSAGGMNLGDTYAMRSTPAGEHLLERLDADPFFGLMTCEVGTNRVWSVAIVPRAFSQHATAASIAVAMQISDLSDLDKRAQQLAEDEKSDQIASLKRQAQAALDAAASAKAKADHLQEARSQLAVGSETGCGLVIDVKGPLIRLQLVGATVAGSNEIWIRRDQFDDSNPPYSCFGHPAP